MRFSKFLFLFVFSVSSFSAAAACMSPRNDQLYGGWVNNCDVWISVVWNDEKYCASGNKKYPCYANVSPNGVSSGHTFGYVNWIECQSPGGPNSVQAIEKEYGSVYCIE
jgi:hypothetical protein